MPGPGGGARGGGGHGGGGGFGGGPRGGGGGFGGGPRGGFGGPRGPRGPRFGYGYYGPRYYRRGYYGGGGCLSSLAALIIVSVLCIVLVIAMIPAMIGGLAETVMKGGTVEYDEKTFQQYADQQYAAEFGSSTAYEDNILIVVTTNEECNEYYFIAWVGDHVRSDVNMLFGGNDTVFGRVMNGQINQTYYAYSLDMNLASVMDEMAQQVTSLIGTDKNSFTCSENHVQVASHLTNKTSLSLTESTVNAQLASFTEQTGIPVVIVVDTQEAVFGRHLSVGTVLALLFVIGLLVLAGYLIYRAVMTARARKNGDGDDHDPNGGYDSGSSYDNSNSGGGW